MATLATLRRFLGIDATFGDTRTGRDPDTCYRYPPITALQVDGWYNFQSETTHGSFRRR